LPGGGGRTQRRELDHGADGVVGAGGYVHALNHPTITTLA
jgi:hypothetical protein